MNALCFRALRRDSLCSQSLFQSVGPDAREPRPDASTVHRLREGLHPSLGSEHSDSEGTSVT